MRRGHYATRISVFLSLCSYRYHCFFWVKMGIAGAPPFLLCLLRYKPLPEIYFTRLRTYFAKILFWTPGLDPFLSHLRAFCATFGKEDLPAPTAMVRCLFPLALCASVGALRMGSLRSAKRSGTQRASVCTVSLNRPSCCVCVRARAQHGHI